MGARGKLFQRCCQLHPQGLVVVLDIKPTALFFCVPPLQPTTGRWVCMLSRH